MMIPLEKQELTIQEGTGAPDLLLVQLINRETGEEKVGEPRCYVED